MLLLCKMKIILPVPKFVYVKTHVIQEPFIWLEVQIIWLVSIRYEFLLKEILKQTLIQIYSSWILNKINMLTGETILK